MTRVQVLRDVLGPGLRAVFCGTAPSPVSAARAAYYAHPGNRFWRVLAETGLTPRQLKPEEFQELPRYGLGLTDLCKYASGLDDALRPGDFDAGAVGDKIRAAKPGILAFTSKTAAREFFKGALKLPAPDYGLQEARLGETRLFVLPSTSGRASGSWTNNRHYWAIFADLIGGKRDFR
jgi:TDG/mug DNA glycosylase family protein